MRCKSLVRDWLLLGVAAERFVDATWTKLRAERWRSAIGAVLVASLLAVTCVCAELVMGWLFFGVAPGLKNRGLMSVPQGPMNVRSR